MNRTAQAVDGIGGRISSGFVFAALFLGVFYGAVSNSHATMPILSLPTDNTAIFQGGPDFYMYVDRSFEGKSTKPWEGGQFGFVRNPVRQGDRLIMSRFHGGIDIKPIRRDASNEPLDDVRSIADGKVVYVSDNPRDSNYGRYIVVEHIWDGCRFYSLYAHLNKTSVTAGQSVPAGTVLGRLGYTGAGINKERSHLHLELVMMMNAKYADYFPTVVKDSANKHGIFNGMNLVSLDIARLYLEQNKNPSITLPQFMAQETVFYRVIVPGDQRPEILDRHPWLTGGAPTGGSPPSWEISFTQWGLPVRITPSTRKVTEPVVSAIRQSTAPYTYYTSGRIGGSGPAPTLTPPGERHVKHFTFPN